MSGQEHIFESANLSNYKETTDPFDILSEAAPVSYTFGPDSVGTNDLPEDEAGELGRAKAGRASVTPNTPSPEQIEMNKFNSKLNKELNSGSKDALDYAIPMDDMDFAYTPGWEDDIEVVPANRMELDYDYDPSKGEEDSLENPEWVLGDVEPREDVVEQPASAQIKPDTSMQHPMHAIAAKLNTSLLTANELASFLNVQKQGDNRELWWNTGALDIIGALKRSAFAVEDLEKREPESKVLPVVKAAQLELQKALAKMLVQRA